MSDYRIVKHTPLGKEGYSICVVTFIESLGEVILESITPMRNTIGEVREDVEKIMRALDKPFITRE